MMTEPEREFTDHMQISPNESIRPAAMRQMADSPPVARESLRQSALAFEAAFLAEMLKSAGVGRIPGQEDDPFASFLTEAHARAMAERGGLGLASRIEAALSRQTPQPDGGESP